MRLFFFLQCKGAAEIHGKMNEVLKDVFPSYSEVNIWVSMFGNGHFDVTDKSRLWKSTSENTVDKAGAVHVLFLKKQRISAKIVNETL